MLNLFSTIMSACLRFLRYPLDFGFVRLSLWQIFLGSALVIIISWIVRGRD